MVLKQSLSSQCPYLCSAVLITISASYPISDRKSHPFFRIKFKRYLCIKIFWSSRDRLYPLCAQRIYIFTSFLAYTSFYFATCCCYLYVWISLPSNEGHDCISFVSTYYLTRGFAHIKVLKTYFLIVFSKFCFLFFLCLTLTSYSLNEVAHRVSLIFLNSSSLNNFEVQAPS